MTVDQLESACRAFVSQVQAADAAHDLAHVQRVVSNVRWLTSVELGDPWVTLPSAWLHDCVAMAKDSPRRNQGSRLAAEAAVEFLSGIGYPAQRLEAVHHAIAAHSFSANIPVRSLEAAIVQDGDRLDSLGAVGIARCLLVGGKLNRPLCSADDPFCDTREPDDSRYTLDHFYAKLLQLPHNMQTGAGRAEAERRAMLMQQYLDQLRAEISGGHLQGL